MEVDIDDLHTATIRHSFLKPSHTFAEKLASIFESHASVDIVKVRSFPYDAYCYRNPNHIREIFANKTVGNRKNMNLLPKILYLTKAGSYSKSDRNDWQDHKRRTNIRLDSSAFDRTLADLDSAVSKTLAAWCKGDVPSIKQATGTLATDICYRLFLSCDLGSELEEAEKLTSDLVDQFADPWPLWLPISKNGTFKRNAAQLRNIVETIILARSKSPLCTSRDVLGQLIQRHSATNELAVIRDEILAILLGGHTMSVTLTWSILVLMRDCKLVALLQQELSEAALVDLHKLDQLPLLDQFLKEILRLYPPGWTTPRFADESIKIAGVRVPKKSLIFPLVYFTHRHPKFWAEPNRFLINRFEPATNIDRFAYLPFGAGYRACPGRSIAPLILKYVLARLLSGYRMEPTDEIGDIGSHFGFELVPDKRIGMRLLKQHAPK